MKFGAEAEVQRHSKTQARVILPVQLKVAGVEIVVPSAILESRVLKEPFWRKLDVGQGIVGACSARLGWDSLSWMHPLSVMAAMGPGTEEARQIYRFRVARAMVPEAGGAVESSQTCET